MEALVNLVKWDRVDQWALRVQLVLRVLRVPRDSWEKLDPKDSRVALDSLVEQEQLERLDIPGHLDRWVRWDQ